MRFNKYLLIIFFLAIPLTLANSIQINDNDIDIFQDEQATFNITFTNTDSIDKSIGVIINSPNWQYYTNPYFVNVDKNSEKNFLLSLKPKEYESGLSKIAIKFLTLPDNQNYNSTLYIYKKNESKMEYVTFLVLNSILNKKEYLPEETLDLSIKVSKLNPKPLENLTIDIQSNLFTRKINFDMKISKEFKDTIEFSIPKKQLPIEDKLKITLYEDNTSLSSNILDLVIPEYSPNLILEKNFSSKFLKQKYNYTLNYNGNIESIKTIEFQDNIITKLFRSYTINTNSSIQNNTLIINVKPFQKYNLAVTYNYIPLLIIFIIIIILSAIYLFFKKPLTVKKEVKKIYESSGIKNIRFLIYLKNNTGTKIHNLRLTESLPNLIEHIPSKEFGVLKPKYINEKEKSFDMIWEFKNFEPYEERIITFDVIAKFDIIGRLKIPPTKLKFLFLGLRRELQSNSILIKVKNKGDMNNKE